MPENLASLRVHRAVSSALITYGVAAFGWFFSRALPQQEGTTRSMLTMFAIGVAIQIAVIIMRKAVQRYERATGIEGQLAPMTMYVIEMLLDGVTVLLFAIATFRSILMVAPEI